MTLGELLDRVRSQYVHRLRLSWEAARARDGVTVLTEVLLCDARGAPVREGEWSLPYRVDSCVVQSGQVVETVTASAADLVAFEPLEFEWSGRLSVKLSPFPWDYCRLTLGAGVSDSQSLRAWFEQWCDPEESRPDIGDGLRGVVHFMSDPEVSPHGARLLVDLGSAPVEAFEQLLDAVAASGQQAVQVDKPAE